jgi:hypothetical protein
MFSKYLLAPLAALLLAAPFAARAQTGGVRIGTAGTPDASAALDIVSTDKGVLLPRVASAAAIASPAPGLLVYQTNSPAGFYYNGGTSAAPAWQQLATAGTTGGAADNLGNHTATQNLNLAGYQLVGGTAAAPGPVGLSISAAGLVSLGSPATTDRPAAGFGYGLRLDNADAGLLATGTPGTGQIPATGAGLRLMWHPNKAALRAGAVDGTQWDDDNIGLYSQAFGNNATASGLSSFASGDGTTASGNYSVALGSRSTASGRYSMALGLRATASGDYSVALGSYASTNSFAGAFILADQSTVIPINNSANNQFIGRFAGGYRLLTNAVGSTGVNLNAGGSSWNVVSDSTKKELRRPVDGNAFLARINRMRLDSWNYIGQDPRTFRHYGPMAQDFFAAFGHDALGVIGNDTSIAQADFDGVNLIAIQALYRRVLALEADNARLRQQLSQPRAAAPIPPATAALEALEARLRRLEAATGGQAQR